MLVQAMTRGWLLGALLEANLNLREADVARRNALALPGDLASSRNSLPQPRPRAAELPLNRLAAARYATAIAFGVNRGEGRAARS